MGASRPIGIFTRLIIGANIIIQSALIAKSRILVIGIPPVGISTGIRQGHITVIDSIRERGKRLPGREGKRILRKILEAEKVTFIIKIPILVRNGIGPTGKDKDQICIMGDCSTGIGRARTRSNGIVQDTKFIQHGIGAGGAAEMKRDILRKYRGGRETANAQAIVVKIQIAPGTSNR